MCSLDRTMESLWEDGRRLVFVSSVPCEGQCLWWPPGTVHNSYANSDTLEVMWFYNRGILEDYRLNATQLFKCAVHAADRARLTHHCIAHHLVAQQRLLADAADNVSLHSPLTQLFAGRPVHICSASWPIINLLGYVSLGGNTVLNRPHSLFSTVSEDCVAVVSLPIGDNLSPMLAAG